MGGREPAVGLVACRYLCTLDSADMFAVVAGMESGDKESGQDSSAAATASSAKKKKKKKSKK